MPSWVNYDIFFCSLSIRETHKKKRRDQILKNKFGRAGQVFRDKTRKTEAQNETSEISRNNSVRTASRMRKIKEFGLLLSGEWNQSADNYSKHKKCWGRRNTYIFFPVYLGNYSPGWLTTVLGEKTIRTKALGRGESDLSESEGGLWERRGQGLYQGLLW